MRSYETRLHWEGSADGGIRSCSRDHTAIASPATARVDLSADPAFRGNPYCLNPEQHFVIAASSCQMLSFLGAAARAGVHVLAYDDDAQAHRECYIADSLSVRSRSPRRW
jgi:organic hydroperoxide reductase OsmC/OhrA